MKTLCVHSCKGLCNALEFAERREQEAIALYREYAAQCDYPDVREILEDLGAEREQALAMLREKRRIIEVKFSMIDAINDNFA
jgi:rubrerythrin